MDRASKIIADALERGAQHKVAVLRAAGGGLSVKEAAHLLGTSTEELEGRKTLLAVSTKNGLVWPKFQFESRTMLEGVDKVLAAVNVDDPWSQLTFFFLRLQELDGKTPVQAIREGALDAVILAATHFGEHGAS